MSILHFAFCGYTSQEIFKVFLEVYHSRWSFTGQTDPFLGEVSRVKLYTKVHTISLAYTVRYYHSQYYHYSRFTHNALHAQCD